MNIEQLNEAFGIEGQLIFVEGRGGLPMIEIRTGKATALISVYGGQVLSYQAADQDELLFVSGNAYFQEGKAIKGGVPVCWPWFGDDPEDKGRGAHGFVRNRMWSVAHTEMTAEGDARVVLGVMDSGETQHLWPHEFDLTLDVIVGETLSITLVTRNLDDTAFPLTQALHTYFKVGDVSQVEVMGLDNALYLDKADAWQEKIQTGPVTVAGEVDRIYKKVRSALVIHDASLKRKIHIQSQGNKTAVVWNPWQEISTKMADLADDDYLQFICVETANAADDVIDMAPGSEYRLSVEYRCENYSSDIKQ